MAMPRVVPAPLGPAPAPLGLSLAVALSRGPEWPGAAKACSTPHCRDKGDAGEGGKQSEAGRQAGRQ